MAPKAAKGKGKDQDKDKAKDKDKDKGKDKAGEPPPGSPAAAAKPSWKSRFKMKPLPPRLKNMLIATFAFVCFCIFVGSCVGYAQLALKKKNPLEEPLKEVRKTIAKAHNSQQLNYAGYIQVADEVLQLPKYLKESEKDYGHRKAKYQTIFKKGALSRAGDHWEVFGRSLFYFSDLEKTWYDAENFCMSRDSHLASILTEDEQFFLSVQLSDPTWIGLTDENVEGEWEWTDGSRVLTQFWSRGVPSPQDDYSDCTYLDPSLDNLNWEHSDCHKLRRWVCKEKLDTDET